MKRMHGIAVAAVIVGTSLGVHVASAAVGNQTYRSPTARSQHRRTRGRPGARRLHPGVAFGRHSHPGEEIVYVLEGSLEYEVDGKPPVTLKAGGVLFIAADTIHSAKNVGNSNAAELATYIVEKGKPLVQIAK